MYHSRHLLMKVCINFSVFCVLCHVSDPQSKTALTFEFNIFSLVLILICFALQMFLNMMNVTIAFCIINLTSSSVPSFMLIVLPGYLFQWLSFLNSAGIGCHIHNCCTNHVFYAYDICVIAPSPSGLQGLLNICAKFGLENDVEYNPIKSLCVVFKPRGFNLKCPDTYINLNKLAYVK